MAQNVILINKNVKIHCSSYYYVRLIKKSSSDTQLLFGSVSKRTCIKFMNDYLLGNDIALDTTLYLVKESKTIVMSVNSQLIG